MRTPKPTVVYIVAESEPSNVFFKKDIATRAAQEQSNESKTATQFEVFTRTVTSEASFLKEERAKAMAALSPEMKLSLGLGPKKTRKKKDATTAANVAA